MDFGTIGASIGGALIASLPGVLVALLTYWLSIWRERQRIQQQQNNARALLSLEVESNRAILRQFWDDINRLDKERDTPGRSTHEHLAGMAAGGLLGYARPTWSYVRWDHFPSDALGGLGAAEAQVVDGMYRDLRAIGERYDKMLSIDPEERALLDKDRFWMNRFADPRVRAFEQLGQIVSRALSTPPLK